MSAQVVVQSMYLLVARYDAGKAARFMLDFRLEESCTMNRCIVLINRYWRDVLAQSPHDTSEARTYLVDDCCVEEWLGLFERGVIPVLVTSVSPCKPQ